MFPHSSNALHN